MKSINKFSIFFIGIILFSGIIMSCSKEETTNNKDLSSKSISLDYDNIIDDLLQAGASEISIDELNLKSKSTLAPAGFSQLQAFQTSPNEVSVVAGYTAAALNDAQGECTSDYKKVSNPDGTVSRICSGEGNTCSWNVSYSPMTGYRITLIVCEVSTK